MRGCLRFHFRPTDFSVAYGTWSDRFQWDSGPPNEPYTGLATAGLVREYTPAHAFVADHAAPYTRPVPGEQAYPGHANWHLRGVRLVHENIFEVTDHRWWYSGQAEYEGSESPLYVKLSNDTFIVPVFVVHWYPDGSQFDYTPYASALFDFMDVTTSVPPNQVAHFWYDELISTISPDAHEYPPDDVWWQPASGCNCLQFQVVGAVRIPMQRTQAKCSQDKFVYEFTSNGDVNNDEFWALLDEAMCPESASGCPEAAYMRQVLKPIFVHYGPMSQCAWSGFSGKAAVSASPAYAHMDNSVPRSTLLTSHELGHILTRDSGHIPDYANLMSENITGSSLTTGQCNRACEEARTYSSRFRDYTRAIGRVPPHATHAQHDSTPGSSVGFTQFCCQLEDQAVVIEAGACFALGGEIVGDYVCKPCCKISDDPPKAIFKDDYDCAPENVLEPKQCSLVCCNSPRGPSVSRYYCEQTGGTIVKCAQPPT